MKIHWQYPGMEDNFERSTVHFPPGRKYRIRQYNDGTAPIIIDPVKLVMDEYGIVHLRIVDRGVELQEDVVVYGAQVYSAENETILFVEFLEPIRGYAGFIIDGTQITKET